VDARFQVKVRLNLSNGWQMSLFFHYAVDLGLRGEISNMLTFGFEAKNFAKQSA